MAGFRLNFHLLIVIVEKPPSSQLFPNGFVHRTSKTFHALDWLAQLTTHIPNKREQMVRYGVYPPWRSYYSNKCRDLRKKNGKDDGTPAVINSDLSRKTFKINWARLIQKIGACPPFFGGKLIL